ncbi:MAG: LEPR-XLL domain-containing protein [Planctomycetes bacterium]|nr:LEPR-XLL domain-containing protein [Planctomycetota bacterium]
MSVWSSVKQALGTAKGRAADSGPMPPTFERLEERILLSADSLGAEGW